MTLHLIGIGLNDEKDISVKGLNIVKKADFVFLENYTSRLQVSVEKLEEFYEKKIILADRETVERKTDLILEKSLNKETAFLVVGDVFSATTHTDLFLRAKKKKISINIVNNASILTAVGITGLELYKFGKTTSIPYPEKNYKPETAYDVIKNNKELGLHTLILLDIKPNKNMTVNESIRILLDIEKKRKENIFTEKTMVLGCARLGGDYKIKCGTISKLEKEDFGKPMHCLIIPGKLHFIEEEALDIWK
ncbi:diphthine synthase [Candidatus Woesearchaeota archaeon]|jgi:diphthine synthase|nr:diphthine synthase [Candidatus Woesearchaeota archaeon]|tara:strand:- start:8 stop:757 length:750 start_codon:yes stop_codon:yes gene_type:complete